ncbi:MAG: 5-carboxymethyl-2-hydroxymuconate isomerase [Chloroflexi bacterium]|nr:5-carboxymethyl-2-hydroxymuconate isomerase [Chloroflexota bacterium]
MPHLSLEYTANIKQEIDSATLFSGLHQILTLLGGINVENCKSRAVCLDDYYIGQADESNAFVHLDISFLHGKSVEIHQAIGKKCLIFLREYFSPSMVKYALQITVVINEIQRSAYFKYPGGTLK